MIRATPSVRGGCARSAASAGALRHWQDLIVAPNIWGGFSELRPGPALGLVGSNAQVAERLADLIALGVDSFILAATPHLEEAFRVGEEVLPLVGGGGTVSV